MTRSLVALLGIVALAACSSGEGPAPAPPPSLTADERALLEAMSPATLPAPPPDATNAWADDPAAAQLGKRLFFDPTFSGKLIEGDNDGSANTLGKKGEAGKVSCAGCHLPDSDFLDTRTLGKEVSLAAGWGKRRAPSLLDVGQAKLVMWDGRRDALYNQIFGALESPVEMNGSRLFMAERVFAAHRAPYEALFGPMPKLDDAKRFPPIAPDVASPQHGAPGDGAEYDGMSADDQTAVTRVVVNAGKAIGAYERKLSCGQGRFDAYLRGTGTLTDAELRGAKLFVGRARCASCHSGPFFSDQKFHNVGLRATTVAVVVIDANDRGAKDGIAGALADPLRSTGVFSDGDDGRLAAAVPVDGGFRTPMLRCVGRRPTFMHTGQLHSLEDTVAFFARGGDAAGYPGTNELQPLALSPTDRSDLVAFLRTLDGEGAAPEWRKP
jgi:cytochrome c peroxidase